MWFLLLEGETTVHLPLLIPQDLHWQFIYWNKESLSNTRSSSFLQKQQMIRSLTLDIVIIRRAQFSTPNPDYKRFLRGQSSRRINTSSLRVGSRTCKVWATFFPDPISPELWSITLGHDLSHLLVMSNHIISAWMFPNLQFVSLWLSLIFV